MKNIISRGAKISQGEYICEKISLGPNKQIFPLPLGGWDSEDILNTHADPQMKRRCQRIGERNQNGFGKLERWFGKH